MKTVLSISLLLNVALISFLLVRRVHGPERAGEPQPHFVVAAQPAQTITNAGTQSSAPAKPEQFQWKQLYAKDYHVYVKNLRAVGCPDPDLRAIVAADVHAAFHQRVEELERNLSDLARNSWKSQLAGWKDEQAWRDELRTLPDQEAAQVADFLGESTTATSPAPAAPNQAETVASDSEPEPIAVPLIAQSVDLATLHLDDGQLEAITNLHQMFLTKIGGPNQDPKDPAYRARWRTAQGEVDALLKGMIGDRAFQDYQLKTFANAQAGAPADP